MTRISMDNALAQVGTGPFQWFALHVCGVANAADAVEILSISLVLPAAEADLGITPSGRAALTTSIFFGMMLGGTLFGLVGDCLGRRVPLIGALLLSGGFGLLSSQATSVAWMAFCRGVAGIGIGGTVPTAFTYMAEVAEQRTRGKLMVALAAHWMLGSIASALLGWLLIPSVGWRAFLAAVAVPSLIGAAEAFLIPESPRFQWIQGHEHKALATLRLMASWNLNSRRGTRQLLQETSDPHGCLLDDPTLQLVPPDTQPDHMYAGSTTTQPPLLSRLCRQAAGVRHQAASLVTPSALPLTVPLAIAWFGLSGGWYGLLLWFPEYMKRRGAEPLEMYLEMLMVALSNLPGNVASFFLVDTFGRRKTLAVAMTGGALSVLCFALLPVNGTRAVSILGAAAVMVFNGISVAGWNSLDLITPELYPATVRCTATGAMGVIGRIGSVAGNAQAAWLIDVAPWAPLVVSALFLVCGTLAVLRLPETARRGLDTPGDEKIPEEDQDDNLADNSQQPYSEERTFGDPGSARHCLRSSTDCDREEQSLLQPHPPE